MDKLDKTREKECKSCLMGIKIENCKECLFNAMCDIEDKYADSDYDEIDETDGYDPMLLDIMFRD